MWGDPGTGSLHAHHPGSLDGRPRHEGRLHAAVINAIVSTPDDLDFRLHLRNEFMRTGLIDALEVRIQYLIPFTSLRTRLHQASSTTLQ